MLRTLRIRNLAVIEAVEVELDPGFTALTGETGAGKSILVEAVGLLLGGRASAELVRTGTDAATIEAAFERPDGTEVLIRRDHRRWTEPLVRGRRRQRRRASRSEVSATWWSCRSTRASLLLDPTTHLGFLDADAGSNRPQLAWLRSMR
jgi:DNA repair ATPase RecN